jgi:hypothetical protein
VLTLLALVLVLISCAILKHQIKLTHRSSWLKVRWLAEWNQSFESFDD